MSLFSKLIKYHLVDSCFGYHPERRMRMHTPITYRTSVLVILCTLLTACQESFGPVAPPSQRPAISDCRLPYFLDTTRTWQPLTPVDERPKIQTTIISGSQLPKDFDSTTTFWYTLSAVEPESLLVELWKAGIPVCVAWLPLDNLCMDLIGPRFTVQLSEEDLRILGYNFARGPGRLACATQLKLFTISK